MDIHIKYLNIKPSSALETYVRDKIGTLEKFTKNAQGEKQTFPDAVQAWVEIGKIGRHHKEGRIWYAECQMRMPRRSMRSTSTHFDLRLAIDEVKAELHRLLKKNKEKQQTVVLHGARAQKRKLRE